MAVTLRYFTEFGKPALQKTICGGIYARAVADLEGAEPAPAPPLGDRPTPLR